MRKIKFYLKMAREYTLNSLKDMKINEMFEGRRS